MMIGCGLAGIAGLSYLSAPKASARILDEAKFRAGIPERVGGWRSRKAAELVLPALDEGDKLYENLETRIYEGRGLPAMMVLVAYSSVQQNDIQVHRPEVCYPAAGFPIVSSEETMLAFGRWSAEAREVVADRGGLFERVIYWVRVGDQFPTSWIDQRLAMAAANLKGTIPDGVLVRISTLEEPGSSTSSDIKTFIDAFLRASPPGFRDAVLL